MNQGYRPAWVCVLEALDREFDRELSINQIRERVFSSVSIARVVDDLIDDGFVRRCLNTPCRVRMTRHGHEALTCERTA